MHEQGICKCGCGAATNWNRKKHQPSDYVNGHQGRAQMSGPRYIVEPETGCWIWQLHTVRGYGQLQIRGQQWLAHRWYYEQAHGPLNGQHLDHLCRNPPCVNPDHLEPVTLAENCRRGNSTLLSRAQVREIRAAPRGYGTGRALARQYGVTNSTISDIRNRRTWADL